MLMLLLLLAQAHAWQRHLLIPKGQPQRADKA
jgi:hypothetical protein